MRWLGLLLLVVACHASPGEDKNADCQIICRCLTALPGEQDQCVAQCVGEVNDQETCTDCLDENEASCSVVVGTCVNMCEPQQLPPGQPTQ